MSDQPKTYCPFCGRLSLDICSSKDSHANFYYVFCNNCEASGPTDYDRREAVALWEHRATEANDEPRG